MTGAAPSRYGPPGASYRLQLHQGFGFAEAVDVVPYLQSLGITHVYLSPIFAAAPGSQHGYDVFDHNTINPELGGLAGLYRLGEELVGRGMGLIVDMVPNHVGVAGGANPWWRSVLQHGKDSPYANHFDIDWNAQPQMTAGVLVFPILGEPFGATLEAGQLCLDIDQHDIVLRYFDNTLPLKPQSYARILGLPPLETRKQLHDPSSLAVLEEALDDLNSNDYERAESGLGHFRGLLGREPAIAQYAQNSVSQWNGEVGDAGSFDRLDELLGEQHYRLADWRIAGSEINYRRFFDQNSLAAIRVERDDVFEETHRLLFDLVARGIVTCVRVDHVDGLYDVGTYLTRLRQGLADAVRGIEGADVPILVEKILESGEELTNTWPIAGTTGYEVLAQIDQILVDSRAAQGMTQTYDRVAGERVSYERLRYEAKAQIAETAFASEISTLAYQLHDIAKRERLQRDVPLRALRGALEATIACFPVYRTYLSVDVTPTGSEYIERATREAARREPGLSQAALAFLREVLLLEGLAPGSENSVQRAQFRRRFQQVTAPIMAKGIEDTAFYRYNRLISLNEVGNEPAQFGTTIEAAHTWFQNLAEHWPHTMAATSTHDTKRSEDVRARIDVLSEIPGQWRQEVIGWARMNERHKTVVDRDPAPDGSMEYYLYQTLVGSWPPGGPDAEYRARLHEHLTKAMREAKQHTTWVSPNGEYETACHRFLERILAPRGAAAFQRHMAAFVASIVPAAAMNSLAALMIKSLAAGFPDFYQGTEVYERRLTDPDNRHEIDFERRRAMLAVIQRSHLPDELGTDEAKLWFIHRLLEIRADWAEALHGPHYSAVDVGGTRAQQLFAFSRGPKQSLVAIVPRLTAAMIDGSGRIPSDAWGDTSITLPGGPWHSLLDGSRVAEGEVRASDILRQLP
ncbi:MAG: malto-oligosyltrehalose synthase, partial [Tepidiformaceae bacterium]